MDLGPVLLGEGHVGEDVLLGLVQQRGELGQLGADLVGDLAPLRLSGVGMILGEGGGDERRHHASPALAGMSQGVAHEMHPAALPGSAEHARDRRLDAFVRIRDHQLAPGQASALQPAQELNPEGLGLQDADRHAAVGKRADHQRRPWFPGSLAAAVGVDGDRDGHRDRDDAPGLAHLHVSRVDPEIGPIAFDGALEESPHPLVDLLAQATHLALRDAGHAQRLDQRVDRSRRDALHIGFLDHCRQRLLGDPARLQETREIASLPELGDVQIDRPGAGLPRPVAVPVALRQPVPRALAIGGAGQALHLELHQPLGGKADHLAQEIGVAALLQQGAKGDPVVGHRGDLRSGVAGRNPTLPKIPRWPPAVDNWPAYARLVAVAAAGQFPTAPTPPPGT
jgi:hypothetical protein